MGSVSLRRANQFGLNEDEGKEITLVAYSAKARQLTASLTFPRNQVYAILDEVFLAGEISETSKQVVLTRLEHLDKLE